MRVGLLDVSDFVRENVGKIMLFTGMILVVAGVLSHVPVGSTFCAATLFTGAVCLILGAFLQLGLLAVKLRSLNGVSIMFFFSAIVCFVFGIVIFQFLDITTSGTELFAWRERVFFWEAILHSEHRFLWLSGISMLAGFILLVFGVVSRLANALKSRMP